MVVLTSFEQFFCGVVTCKLWKVTNRRYEKRLQGLRFVTCYETKCNKIGNENIIHKGGVVTGYEERRQQVAAR